jgi:hypothetical protein
MQDRERAAGKEAQLGFQLVGVARIFGQDQHGGVNQPRELRKCQRRARADQAAPAGITAGSQVFGYEVGGVGQSGRTG